MVACFATRPPKGVDKADFFQKFKTRKPPATPGPNPRATHRPAPRVATPVSNQAIKAETLRVVFPDGSHRILSHAEAMAAAQALHLDLVQVPGSADPPVARLTSLAQLREQARAVADAALKKGAAAGLKEDTDDAPKELHLSAVIGPHDVEVKLQQARSWLAKQWRVALYVKFKKPEDQEAAAAMAQRLADSLQDAGATEHPVRQYKGSREVRVVMKPKPAAASSSGATSAAARSASGAGATSVGEALAAGGAERGSAAGAVPGLLGGRAPVAESAGGRGPRDRQLQAPAAQQGVHAP